MTNNLQFDLVSPERQLLSETVEMVVVPGMEGDFGVLEHEHHLFSDRVLIDRYRYSTGHLGRDHRPVEIGAVSTNDGDEIAFELVGFIEETDYLGFGISGHDNRTEMVGADVVIGDLFRGEFETGIYPDEWHWR